MRIKRKMLRGRERGNMGKTEKSRDGIHHKKTKFSIDGERKESNGGGERSTS